LESHSNSTVALDMFENLGVQADDGTVSSLTKSSLTSILISNPLITERKYAEAKTRVSVISPIKDLTGRIRAFSKIAHDITGRTRAEESLRPSEERLRLAQWVGRVGT